MIEEYCKTIAPQYAIIVEKNEKDMYYSWYSEENKQNEIMKEIDTIAEFLKSNYGLEDKNVELSVYIKDSIPYINGVRFEIDVMMEPVEEESWKLAGEFFIVFMALQNRKPFIGEYPYYIFRTEINKIPEKKIPCDPIDVYMRFKMDILQLSKTLGLKIDKIEHFKNRHIYVEPIFYRKQKKVDVTSFKEFIEDISDIAKVLPLELPGVRWYSGCSKIKE